MAIQQTKLLLGHIQNDDKTGHLLLGELECTQMISRLRHSILKKQSNLTYQKWTDFLDIRL